MSYPSRNRRAQPIWQMAHAGGGSYVGPGDVVSGAFAFWGLFAYNAAYATGSNPACDLVDQAGLNPITINILSSGALDTASISTWVTAHSVTKILVKKLYDQVGTQHMTQATVANMPPLTLSSIGSFAALTPDGTASQQLTSTAAASHNQPFSMSALAQRSSGTNAFVFSDVDAGSNEIDLSAVNNGLTNTQFYISDGISDNSTVDDFNLHAVTGVFNNPTGLTIVVDTTVTTSAAGGNVMTSGDTWVLLGFTTLGLRDWIGKFGELGIWPTAFNSTQYAAMNSNIHTRWGF